VHRNKHGFVYPFLAMSAAGSQETALAFRIPERLLREAETVKLPWLLDHGDITRQSRADILDLLYGVQPDHI
jgi:hypothetical protein